MSEHNHEIWERFLQLVEDIRSICDKYHAGIYARPGYMEVRFQLDAAKPSIAAGEILMISPGQCMYTHPEETHAPGE